MQNPQTTLFEAIIQQCQIQVVSFFFLFVKVHLLTQIIHPFQGLYNLILLDLIFLATFISMSGMLIKEPSLTQSTYGATLQLKTVRLEIISQSFSRWITHSLCDTDSHTL